MNVLDLTGRTVLQQGVTAESAVLDVAGLQTGRYLVQLRMADGGSVVRSFVKQ